MSGGYQVQLLGYGDVGYGSMRVKTGKKVENPFLETVLAVPKDVSTWGIFDGLTNRFWQQTLVPISKGSTYEVRLGFNQQREIECVETPFLIYHLFAVIPVRILKEFVIVPGKIRHVQLSGLSSAKKVYQVRDFHEQTRLLSIIQQKLGTTFIWPEKLQQLLSHGFELLLTPFKVKTRVVGPVLDGHGRFSGVLTSDSRLLKSIPLHTTSALIPLHLTYFAEPIFRKRIADSKRRCPPSGRCTATPPAAKRTL